MPVEASFLKLWLQCLPTTFWSTVHKMSVKTMILWHKVKAVNFALFYEAWGNYGKEAPSQSTVICLWAEDTLRWWLGIKVLSGRVQAVKWRLMRSSQKYTNETFIWLHNFIKFFVTCFPEKIERRILKEIVLMLLFISHHLQSYADLLFKVQKLMDW